jgi:hypothetical protein
MSSLHSIFRDVWALIYKLYLNAYAVHLNPGQMGGGVGRAGADQAVLAPAVPVASAAADTVEAESTYSSPREAYAEGVTTYCFDRRPDALHAVHFCGPSNRPDKYIAFHLQPSARHRPEELTFFSDWKSSSTLVRHNRVPDDIIGLDHMPVCPFRAPLPRITLHKHDVTVTQDATGLRRQFEGVSLRHDGATLWGFSYYYFSLRIHSVAFSTDSSYVAVASYEEDGDYREYPCLEVFDLRPVYAAARTANWNRRRDWLALLCAANLVRSSGVHPEDDGSARTRVLACADLVKYIGRFL